MNSYMVAGYKTLIRVHKYLSNMGLNYQTLLRGIEPQSDGDKDILEIVGYLPFLIFQNYCFLSSTQLRNMQQNLYHSSVENSIGIIYQAELRGLPEDIRSLIASLRRECLDMDVCSKEMFLDVCKQEANVFYIEKQHRAEARQEKVLSAALLPCVSLHNVKCQCKLESQASSAFEPDELEEVYSLSKRLINPHKHGHVLFFCSHFNLMEKASVTN